MSYMIFLFIYSMIYLRGIMNRRFYYRAVSVVFVLALLMTAFAGCGKGTDASLAGSVMKNYAKKMICAFLTALMVITVMPASAYAADGISYVRRSWNSSTKMVEKVTDTCTNYTHLWDYSEDDDHTLYSGWYIADNGLTLVSDTSAIEPVIKEILAANEKAVSGYLAGEEKNLTFLIGQSMRALKGKADHQVVRQTLIDILNGMK